MQSFRYRSYYLNKESNFYYLQSRYYDPVTHRFINADSIVDGGSGLLGNNLFVYAANNPINNDDPTGHWIIKAAIKWCAEKIVKPVVKKIQNWTSKCNFTLTIGLSANFSPGIWNFNLQGGISIDAKGNVAFQGSFVGGAITNGGVSIGTYSMITNAPSVNKLNGPSYQFGGSVNVPTSLPVSTSLGGEFNVIPDNELNTHYYGITSFVGVAPPTASVESHAEWGETRSASFGFNVYDVMRNIYINIMEW